MTQQIKQVLATSGYGPIYSAIDKSITDLKQAGYDRGEIKETIVDMFGGDNGPIDQYISNHL